MLFRGTVKNYTADLILDLIQKDNWYEEKMMQFIALSYPPPPPPPLLLMTLMKNHG